MLTRKVREMLNARPPRVATVLVIEPDDDIRQLLSRILASAGYEVVEQAGPAASEEPRIDVALVDVGPGDPQALAAIQALEDQHPEAALVMMAGAFGDALLRDAGATVTLQKPLNESNVLDAVARARRRGRPAPAPKAHARRRGSRSELVGYR
jgi:DNA-binding NtrC family response regulator